jgi:hypothetical protein
MATVAAQDITRLLIAWVSVLIAAVAFMAGWLSARLAARIDPGLALRMD